MENMEDNSDQYAWRDVVRKSYNVGDIVKLDRSWFDCDIKVYAGSAILNNETVEWFEIRGYQRFKVIEKIDQEGIIFKHVYLRNDGVRVMSEFLDWNGDLHIKKSRKSKKSV